MTPEALEFSIVIPTYNRPQRLSDCLKALSQLDYPRDRFEVIVVDDGSSTDLLPVVLPFQSRLHLTLLKQSNAGPAAARNTGAAIASGQCLVFTDDDCMPKPNWLSALSDSFATSPHCLVGGQTLNALLNNTYSTTSQLLIDYLYQYYNSERQCAHFFASNNFALPTELFQKLGGFDTTFPLAAGEDREFCDRWLQAGYTMTYAPNAQILHAHHLTLRTFWKQHFNYGRGAFYFHELRAQRNQQQMKVEPFSFYTNLLTYPLQRVQPLQALGSVVLLLISQAANVLGFFWQQKQA